MKYVDAMHMYTARKIARKTSVKTLNLKGEMFFATETRLALQFPFPQVSESIGNHDSKIVDAGSVN
jgi:hypothetical protein